jgi:hypothetical protein
MFKYVLIDVARSLLFSRSRGFCRAITVKIDVNGVGPEDNECEGLSRVWSNWLGPYTLSSGTHQQSLAEGIMFRCFCGPSQPNKRKLALLNADLNCSATGTRACSRSLLILEVRNCRSRARWSARRFVRKLPARVIVVAALPVPETAPGHTSMFACRYSPTLSVKSTALRIASLNRSAGNGLSNNAVQPRSMARCRCCSS